MGDDDHRHARLPAGILQQLQNLLARHVVQCARRLVTQEQLGILCQGAGNGHPLLLSAGKLGREILCPLGKTHPLQNLHRVQRIAADLRRHLHIFKGSQVLDQIIKLEHESHVMTAVHGQTAWRIGGDLLTVNEDPARREAVHTTEDVQQRSLSRAGGADDDADLTLVDGKAGIMQRVDLHLAHRINFTDVLKFHKMTHVRTCFLFFQAKYSITAREGGERCVNFSEQKDFPGCLFWWQRAQIFSTTRLRACSFFRIMV